MKKRKHETAAESIAAPDGRPRMMPMDVQQKEFRLAFRGYNERDVDEFLDEVTEALAAHIEENRQLREQAAAGRALAGSASSQADQTVVNAREEAARIVREAEERAAVLAGSTVDARTIVAPYLSREREFLQSLGQLVQSHAEAVRGLAQAHRERVPSVPSGSPGSAPESEPVRVPEAAEVEDAIAGTEDDAPVVASGTGEEGDERPNPPEVRLEEPVKTEPQRSLRELFWGED